MQRMGRTIASYLVQCFHSATFLRQSFIKEKTMFSHTFVKVWALKIERTAGTSFHCQRFSVSVSLLLVFLPMLAKKQKFAFRFIASVFLLVFHCRQCFCQHVFSYFYKGRGHQNRRGSSSFQCQRFSASVFANASKIKKAKIGISFHCQRFSASVSQSLVFLPMQKSRNSQNSKESL